MHAPRIAPLALVLVVAAASAVHAQPRVTASKRPAAPTVSRSTPSVLNHVAPQFRHAVNDVVANATLTTQAKEIPFVAHPNIFDWLTEHPDRASLAWRRMGVPCVEIKQLADGRFTWAEDGSELAWHLVGRFENGMIWYATGQVKPGALLPTVPVKAVAVMSAPRTADERAGTTELSPSVTVYLRTDSRAATAALRVIGPAAPRMAEQGAEQLLLFFTGPARHIHRHPDQSDTLLAPAK